MKSKKIVSAFLLSGCFISFAQSMDLLDDDQVIDHEKIKSLIQKREADVKNAISKKFSDFREGLSGMIIDTKNVIESEQLLAPVLSEWKDNPIFMERLQDIQKNGFDFSKEEHKNLFLQSIDSNKVNTVRLLLRKGAQKNINESVDNDNYTPLVRALISTDCSEEIVSLLISHGADLKVRFIVNGIHNTPLTYSLRENKIEVAKILIKNGGPFDIPSQNETLVSGLDPNEVTSNPEILDSIVQYPIHIAVENGQDEIVSILVNSDPEALERLTSFGRTPLHIASFKGNQTMVGFLTSKIIASDHSKGIEKDSLINAKDRFFLCPIHLAARSGNQDVILILKQNGADINSKDSSGNTPLHYASNSGHQNLVDLILTLEGVEKDAKNQNQQTYLEVKRDKNIGDLFIIAYNAAYNFFQKQTEKYEKKRHEPFVLEVSPEGNTLQRVQNWWKDFKIS